MQSRWWLMRCILPCLDEYGAKMTCGIYSIINNVTNKIYIGSSKNIEKRLYEHMRLLKNKRHPNIKLTRSAKKHGEESFYSKVELICDTENLLMYEQIFIDFYNSAIDGYNINKKAERGFSKEPLALSEEFFASRSKWQENGCRVATNAATGCGGVHVKRGGKQIGIHRLAYEFYVGEIPKGKSILRTCKNKRCINPEHLIISNRSEIAKHTFKTGRKHPRGNVKLTEENVKEIKMSNKPMLHLAKQFGVCEATIRKIKRGEIWKHVNIRLVAGENAAALEPFSIDPQPYPMRVWA